MLNGLSHLLASITIHVWFSMCMQACLGGKARGPVDSIALAELMSMGFDKSKGTHTVPGCGFISRLYCNFAR